MQSILLWRSYSRLTVKITCFDGFCIHFLSTCAIHFSDDDFKSLVNGSHADCKEDSQGKHAWKATKDGDEYMLMRRQAFGDGDKQHYVVCNKSTPNKKKGFVVGHGDFTAVVGCFENDTDYPSGSVITKLQAICESYKEQGY